MKNLKINNALISVSDKSNLEKILRILKRYKINIISSEGTFGYIKKLGYKCTEISKFTNFKEMLDGRIKTLHPKIHAGILYDRFNKKHRREMNQKKFKNIDLIIVNLYPFREVVANSKKERKIIENIDIGGPAMIRAAAKNFKNVSIVTSKNDYKFLINELNKYKGHTTLHFRESMASKAFDITANYDSIISNWFNKKLKIKFPDTKMIYGKKIEELRYGENPHQQGSIYGTANENGLKKIKGKPLSYNNYNDIFSGLEILSSLKKTGTVIIKHANPCGVSTNNSPIKSFENSLNCDPISAFGGIVACNFKIKKNIAKKMSSVFFEVILAKGIDKDALKIFSARKNLILIDISRFKNETNDRIKYFGNSFLSQDRDYKVLDAKKIKFVTKLKPTKKELKKRAQKCRVCI